MGLEIYTKVGDTINPLVECLTCHIRWSDPEQTSTECPSCGSTNFRRLDWNCYKDRDLLVVKDEGSPWSDLEKESTVFLPSASAELLAILLGCTVEELKTVLLQSGVNKIARYKIDVSPAHDPGSPFVEIDSADIIDKDA